MLLYIYYYPFSYLRLQIATLNFYNDPEKENQYLDKIISTQPFYKELAIVNSAELAKYKTYNIRDDYYVLERELKNGKYLVAVLDTENLKKNLITFSFYVKICHIILLMWFIFTTFADNYFHL